MLVEELTTTVKDLNKGCEYTFRVTADNEAGLGAPGAESDVIIALDPIRKFLLRSIFSHEGGFM